MVYRFRVTYEDHEDVYRDIDIKVNQTFTDLHLAIQQAISFDNSKDTSFYTSDDYWRKEEEIPVVTSTITKDNKGKPKKTMHALAQEETLKKKAIADYITHPHQKFVYVFDPEKEWTFNVELIKILPDDASTKYPKCVKTIGNSPKQYKEVNLPPPPAEEDAEPKTEKEELLPIVEEVLATDDEAEEIVPIEEGEVEIAEEGEGEESDPESEEPSEPEEDIL